MTEKQYKEYNEIKKEVDELKNFLSWCGRKFDNMWFSLCGAKLIGKKRKIFLRYIARGCFAELEPSKELQTEILEVIERYVERREKDMEAI